MTDAKEPNSWPYPSHRPPIDISLVVLPEHTCSYFSDRISQSRAFLVSGIHPELYHKYMDANFRRSGQLIYQPICHTCRECKQIRVITNEFSMSKSQRRCHNRNSDLSYVIGEPAASQEKYELYSRYQTQWHHKAEEENDYDGFVSFLYRSPVQTIEYCYRDKSGKLVAVGICDVCDQSLSSVYFYYDPAEAKRALGVYSAIVEIAHARDLGIPYYYMGYWIKDCKTMDYKIHYGPSEVLEPDGRWVRQK